MALRPSTVCHRWHANSPAYIPPLSADPVAQWTVRQILPRNMSAKEVANTFYDSMRNDDMDTWLATLATINRAWPGGRVNENTSGPFHGNQWYVGRNKVRKYDVYYTYKKGAPAYEEEAEAKAKAEEAAKLEQAGAPAPETDETAEAEPPAVEETKAQEDMPIEIPPNREVPFPHEETVKLTYDAHFGPDVPGYKGMQIGARGSEWRKGPDANIQGEPTVTILLRREYGQWRVVEAIF
ncbi:hypothetical protein RI054_03g15110 [Pseudoscourfieldia marina]